MCLFMLERLDTPFSIAISIRLCLFFHLYVDQLQSYAVGREQERSALVGKAV